MDSLSKLILWIKNNICISIDNVFILYSEKYGPKLIIPTAINISHFFSWYKTLFFIVNRFGILAFYSLELLNILSISTLYAEYLFSENCLLSFILITKINLFYLNEFAWYVN